MTNLTEHQPLLAAAGQDGQRHSGHQEEDDTRTRDAKHLVDFDPNGDPENPRDWPKSFKWCIVLLLACMAFTITFTCICVVPVAAQITHDLNGGEGDPSASALLVTIWELGEAAGPLLIAPLSELRGRYMVLNTANLLFILATALAATAQSPTLFIAYRCLTGLSVAANVLNPAIIGDLFDADERGSAMSLVMLAPLIGSAVGPAISGAIAETLGWRQVLWCGVGLAVICEVLFLTCFRETYKMAILRNRVARLRAEGHAEVYLATADGHGADVSLWYSISRPFVVLFGSGVLAIMSVFGAVSFGWFYVIAVSFPNILRDIYGFTPAMTGSAFIVFSMGSFCAVFACNAFLDKIYVSLRTRGKNRGHPEYRLPLSLVGALGLPLSLIAYGWIAHLHLPAPLLLLAVAAQGFSLLFATLPLSAYVVDAFGMYAASAMTAVIVSRCLASTFLPLSVAPLVRAGGYGWGFTAFGVLSLGISPIPMIVMRYGEQWRKRSVYSAEA